MFDHLHPAWAARLATYGCVKILRLTANWGALREVAMDSLKSLQSCLDDNAGCDNLNSGNIFVTYCV